jgi:predicted MFS family arabinose efflux permease
VLLKSPIALGVKLLPLFCSLLPGFIIASQVISRYGCFRLAICCGWILTTIGVGLFILLDENTKTLFWFGMSIVFGVGNGMLLSAINFGIQTLVLTEDAGRAASMYTFMRSLGMAIGVAVGGTVFQNVMNYKIRELGLSESIVQEAEGYIAVLKTLAKSDPIRIKAIQAYVYGFHGVFVVLMGISLLGLLTGYFVRRNSSDSISNLNYDLNH